MNAKRLAHVLMVLVITSSAPINTLEREQDSESHIAAAAADTTTRVSVASDGTQANAYSYRPSISADGRYVSFESGADNLVIGDTNGYQDIFAHDRVTGETSRVSVASDGTQANSSSRKSSISADGSIVAFYSNATNLVIGDTNGAGDIFVHDRVTGETSRVSVASDGTQANNYSDAPTISADGRFVAFESSADNLVIGDTNGYLDIFFHDRVTGETSRVSVATDWTQGNNPSSRPSISGDGRFVQFESGASNLVIGDTNGATDVFVRDMATGETSRVSVATGGVQGNSSSWSYPSAISADGRNVVFTSYASNLVNNDTNGSWDVFVHDRVTGVTSRVSVATGGTQGSGTFVSVRSVISADGRYAVFPSYDSTLVSGDTNGTYDVFVHDRVTAVTSRVSVATDGTQANGGSDGPSVSADGRFVAFESGAANLVIEDTNNSWDIFVHDRQPLPVLSIPHIEVSNAIQDQSNSVPLIAGKLTLVRVYVDCGAGCTSLTNVTGVLRGYGPSGELPGSPISPSGLQKVITAYHVNDWSTQRAYLTQTLNFTLPPGWTSGTVTLTAQVASAQASITRPFMPARPPRVAVMPIHYIYNGVDARPSPSTVQTGHSWTYRVYPVGVQPIVLPEMPWVGSCFGNYCSRIVKGVKEIILLLRLKGELWWHNLLNPDKQADYIFGWLPPETYSGGAGVLSGTTAFGGDHPVYGLGIFAHEVAHMLGRPHTKVGTQESCENPSPDPSDWPPEYPDAKIQEWGLDGRTFGWLISSSSALKNPSETYDYMSYCWVPYGTPPQPPRGPAWTSPHTYMQLYTQTMRMQAPALTSDSPLASQPYFIASGLVYTDNTTTLDPIWVITSTSALSNPPTGTAYCLDAQNSSGTALTSRCFDLSFTDHLGEPVGVDFFNLMLPYPPGVSRIVLKRGAQELAVRPVSANAPTVTVLSPNGGETWAATGAYTITWTAADIDGDTLTYNVFYSPDGSNWVPVGTGITTTQLAANSAELAGGSEARIQVMASDGVNTTVADSASFSVGRKGPQIYILSPEGDGVIPPNTPLFLEGYAYDLEDGMLGNTALSWSSSRDGNLGTGINALVTLSAGQHIVTLSATETDCNTATASINLFVGYKTYLPVVLRNYYPLPPPQLLYHYQFDSGQGENDPDFISWGRSYSSISGSTVIYEQGLGPGNPGGGMYLYNTQTFLLSMASPNVTVSGSYEISAQFNVYKGKNNARYGIVFGADNGTFGRGTGNIPTFNINSNYYKFSLQFPDGPGNDPADFQLERCDGNGTLCTKLVDRTPIPISAAADGVWDTVTIRRQGSSIVVLVNNTQLISVSDGAFTGAREFGMYIQSQESNSTTSPLEIDFDNYRVSQLP